MYSCVNLRVSVAVSLEAYAAREKSFWLARNRREPGRFPVSYSEASQDRQTPSRTYQSTCFDSGYRNSTPCNGRHKHSQARSASLLLKSLGRGFSPAHEAKLERKTSTVKTIPQDYSETQAPNFQNHKQGVEIVRSADLASRFFHGPSRFHGAPILNSDDDWQRRVERASRQ